MWLWTRIASNYVANSLPLPGLPIYIASSGKCRLERKTQYDDDPQKPARKEKGDSSVHLLPVRGS